MTTAYRQLPRNSNQARGLAEYAITFLRDGRPALPVLERVELFHADSVGCAVGAIMCRANAPRVLREEALEYPFAEDRRGAVLFGDPRRVSPEKAVLANVSAVRELDANGTNFGYNARTGTSRGEFGHHDFYPVAVAGASVYGHDGCTTLRAMLALDEIRGRLAEVFGLKDYGIDHVLHGAIASAVVYGALAGGSPEQIESAVGQLVAHFVPFRAIRAGHQLSDSKGASAAISSELAVLSVHRALRGFVGPADIFRNPQSVFSLMEPPATAGESPFDLELATAGEDFAVMGMHFKLGLYEHQSAGAIQGLIDILERHPELLREPEKITAVRIRIYEPAFSIIGDPAKRDPRTRQSADHSMVYIVATLLRKAFEHRRLGWRELMLLPEDYEDDALFDTRTRRWMDMIHFEHGGQAYDDRYPDGIPTSLDMEHTTRGTISSGLVMYPLGHARSTPGERDALLKHKFRQLTRLGTEDPDPLWQRVTGLTEKSAEEIAALYAFPLTPGVETTGPPDGSNLGAERSCSDS